MSSLTVMCPNAHRVKVTTSQNMSLQAVLEVACKIKGFDSAVHVLERNNKRIDLSTTVRFSGLPNNATLEMVRLSEEDILRTNNQVVSVCLQTPSGERLVDTFPATTTLGEVVGKWKEKLGTPESGEEPVVVYMRREVVGQEELDTTTLKILGLTQGKGLFRFFYKQPSVLKNQANVYDMKVDRPSPAPEERHIPMRLEPELVKVDSPQLTVQRDDNAMDSSEAETKPHQEEQEPVASSSNCDSTQARKQESSTATPSEPMTVTEPDTTQPAPEAIINPVGPHGAIVFSMMEESGHYQDLDDDFFELSLDEVKHLYKGLKEEVKQLNEGGMMMTKEMREAVKEGEKLSLLSRYKSGILRIQFPSRHIVQGSFPPHTTISEVLAWLSPLLSPPNPVCELYTAPPRTTLPPSSTLLDLQLYPAALVHFSSQVTSSGLSAQALASLSNTTGANTVASQSRREGMRGGIRQLGLQGELPVQRDLHTISESRSLESTGGAGVGGHQGGTGGGLPGKVPKWFKTGK